MKRSLFLHLGVHRTATTSTQGFFQENFLELQKRGFLYPFKVRRHQFLRQIAKGMRDVDEVARDLERRAAEKSPDIRSILLSHEDVCMCRDLSALAGFKTYFDVKVIFSVRRQDTWLESWYFQNIKAQWDPKLAHVTFDEFMAKRGKFHWIDYDRYLGHLEDVFGHENVELIVYEKGQLPQGPVVEFCKRVGLTDLRGLVEPVHVNSSRSPEMSEFMRRLPLDMADERVRLALTQSCEAVDHDILGNTKRQSERLLPPDLRREIMAEYAPGNHAVAQRYLDRDELFFEPLPGPDAPLAKLKLPQDSATLMEQFVAPLLAELIRRDAIGPAKYRDIKKKPKGDNV